MSAKWVSIFGKIKITYMCFREVHVEVLLVVGQNLNAFSQQSYLFLVFYLETHRFMKSNLIQPLSQWPTQKDVLNI